MKQEQLSLYTVDIKLIRNMHNQGDDRVFSVSPQVGKDNRPFVGIIVVLDEHQYCIPLSSPKPKHNKMKNGVDFHRILDSNGEMIGVLDFNNMIPVRKDVIQKIDLKIYDHDSPSTKRYKELMSNQISFCRQNHNVLVNKANRLYKMVKRKNTSVNLKRRCLKWDRLEQVLDRFSPRL